MELLPPHETQQREDHPIAALLSELLLLAVAAAVAFLLLDARAPPQHLPWKPLSLDHPVGMATRAKLMRATAEPDLCRAVLSEGGVAFRPAPDRRERDYCAIEDGVILRASGRLHPPGAVMACGEALSYLIWLRQEVQPAARELLGSPVAYVDHYGTYSCRRVSGGGEAARVSQHARANALDMAAFRLEDGRTVSVRRQWRSGGPDGAFLRRVRDGACGVFSAVLSPDYNAAHADHLHLDRGPYRLCR